VVIGRAPKAQSIKDHGMKKLLIVWKRAFNVRMNSVTQPTDQGVLKYVKLNYHILFM
jgi:hypothetical protein